MERQFAAVLDDGSYFTFTLDTEDVSDDAAAEWAYDFVMTGGPIYGAFARSGAPPLDKSSLMRINPAKVVGVLEKP